MCILNCFVKTSEMILFTVKFVFIFGPYGTSIFLERDVPSVDRGGYGSYLVPDPL
jgi:hypothetical protein